MTDVKYRAMKPDDPDNLRKLAEGKTPAYQKLTAAELAAEVLFREQTKLRLTLAIRYVMSLYFVQLRIAKVNRETR